VCKLHRQEIMTNWAKKYRAQTQVWCCTKCSILPLEASKRGMAVPNRTKVNQKLELIDWS